VLAQIAADAEAAAEAAQEPPQIEERAVGAAE
jgi:hypothetical protein